jgi:hypothetical protein
MEKVYLFLSKLGTMLVDRRFLQALGTTLVSLLVLASVDQEVVDSFTKAWGTDGEAIATLLEQIVRIVVIVFPQIKVVGSWTERAPSGLDYKTIDKMSAYIEERFG